MSDKKALSVSKKATKAAVGFRAGVGIDIETFSEALEFAAVIVEEGMAPKGMSRPGAIVAMWQKGAEIGIPKMEALSALTFVNGRFGIMAKPAKALVRKKGGLKEGTDFTGDFEGEGDQRGYVVTAHPSWMDEPVSCKFSISQAKRAKLWGKAGPWSEHPDVMMQRRAEGRLLGDYFDQYLSGIAVTEEPDAVKRRKKEKDVTPPKSEPSGPPAEDALLANAIGKLVDDEPEDANVVVEPSEEEMFGKQDVATASPVPEAEMDPVPKPDLVRCDLCSEPDEPAFHPKDQPCPNAEGGTAEIPF